MKRFLGCGRKEGFLCSGRSVNETYEKTEQWVCVFVKTGCMWRTTHHPTAVNWTLRDFAQRFRRNSLTFFNVYPLHNSGKMRGFYTTGIMHLWCALLCKSRFKCQYRVGQVYTPEAVKTENYGCCKLCVLTAFANEHVARNVPNWWRFAHAFWTFMK